MATTSPSERLTGYVDDAWAATGFYGQLVESILEHIPDLRHPTSIKTFAQMRHDPQLAAIVKVYSLAIRRARWGVDGKGCRDEVVQQVADDLGLPVLGADDNPTGARRRGFTFADHLRVSLLDQVFGHMFFEQAWEQADGRWRLATVQERMPQTIVGLDLNDDGTLKAVQQYGKMTGSGDGDIPIPTANHRLVYYVNEREGSNYFGQSLLRPSYAPWLIKTEMLRVHATSIRRFGMGIPGFDAPPNATPQQIAEAQRIIGSYKASENGGLVAPFGFTAKLVGLTGSVPDAVEFINYLDRQMTRSTLTSLLDMATAERGSRALGETVMDLMIYAQQAVAEAHADVATSQIVVPLVDANWGEDEPAPRVVVGDVGADVELTAQDIYWLTAYAALTNDPVLETYIRGRYGIPDIDDKYIREPAPAGAPPAGGPSDG